jgi:hypothetical protein
MVALEHEADSAPAACQRTAAQRRHVLIVADDRAGIGPLDRPGQVQQRRLARPGRPGERHERAGLDREADVIGGTHQPVLADP